MPLVALYGWESCGGDSGGLCDKNQHLSQSRLRHSIKHDTYTRWGRSMTVIEGPVQLDERSEGGALEKWSDVHALLGKGLGSVV
jgi:hypothetical protein